MEEIENNIDLVVARITDEVFKRMQSPPWGISLEGSNKESCRNITL